jgi:hypothetical protein
MVPYEARPSTNLSYGYTDKRLDAMHYAVAYTDNREDEAQSFLELRAAEIAQKVGFPYFVFDTRGSTTLEQTNTDIAQNSLSRGSFTKNQNNTMPEEHPAQVTIYYNAWGEISLLTADQAQGNAKAIQVSQVLAQRGSNAHP